MSRFLKTAIVLLAIAAMVTPVMADERLSLSGYYTLRAYSKDNANWNDDSNDSTQYTYQRLRVGGKLAVADGVSVNFRADVLDAVSPEPSQGKGNVEFDKVYATIDKDFYTLSAGQMGGGFGNAMLEDFTNDTAIDFTIKSINLMLEYRKLSEGDTGEYDDVDLYSATWKMSQDNLNLAAIVGYVSGGDNDSQVVFAGVNPVFNLGAAKLNIELDYLDGDYDDVSGTTVDMKGLQFYTDISFALTEQATVGGAFVYAKGYDGANEEQITGIGYDFEPEEYGYMKTIMGGAYEGNALDVADANTGAISGQFYAAFQVNDSLGLKGSLTYAEPEASSSVFDSFIVAGASARYKLAANTTVDAQYIYSQPDTKAGQPDDAKMLAGCRLTVSF